VTIIQAVIMGMVQGLTEFLPVSSSGHIILLPTLFGWGEPSTLFQIALHLGTLLKLNFEISYLTFKGGWDVLGMFQFRYGYFPR